MLSLHLDVFTTRWCLYNLILSLQLNVIFSSRCNLSKLDVIHVGRQKSAREAVNYFLTGLIFETHYANPRANLSFMQHLRNEFKILHKFMSSLGISTIVASCSSWQNIPLNIQVENWDFAFLSNKSISQEKVIMLLQHAEPLNYKKKDYVWLTRHFKQNLLVTRVPITAHPVPLSPNNTDQIVKWF